MKALLNWKVWPFPLESLGPMLGWMIILIPVLWCGPWLPLTDIVAFASMNSYPPSLSYGPDHYYLLQLTYILPVIISRLFVDLGLAVAYQVVLFYLIHALSYFLICWFLLRRFIANPHLRNSAMVLGAISFWDGQLLWGGPMAFSLGAVLGAWAIYLSVEEGDHPEKSQSGLVLTMILLSVLSHPFLLPFGLLLYGVRFVHLKGRRLNSLIVIGLLLVYQVIIRSESPEDISGPILARLFGWYPEQFAARFKDLFTWNSHITVFLFGVDPLPLHLYFYALAFLHLIGFALSPLAWWISRGKPGRQILFAFGTLAGLLYFWSKSDNDLIWWWPQRILTVYSGITYVTGIVAPLVVFFWARERWPILRFRFNNPLRFANWLLIGVMTVGLLYCQISIFRLSTDLFQRYAELKAQIINSGVHDTELTLVGVNVQPWYLRCAPFILFSDPDLIQRKILVYTEWHQQGRHPTRINPYNTLTRIPLVVDNSPQDPQPVAPSPRPPFKTSP